MEGGKVKVMVEGRETDRTALSLTKEAKTSRDTYHCSKDQGTLMSISLGDEGAWACLPTGRGRKGIRGASTLTTSERTRGRRKWTVVQHLGSKGRPLRKGGRLLPIPEPEPVGNFSVSFLGIFVLFPL